MNKIIAVALLCGIAAIAVAHAQTPPANPLDVIPDTMPFDVPYGAPIK